MPVHDPASVHLYSVAHSATAIICVPPVNRQTLLRVSAKRRSIPSGACGSAARCSVNHWHAIGGIMGRWPTRVNKLRDPKRRSGRPQPKLRSFPERRQSVHNHAHRDRSYREKLMEVPANRTECQRPRESKPNALGSNLSGGLRCAFRRAVPVKKGRPQSVYRRQMQTRKVAGTVRGGNKYIARGRVCRAWR